MKNEEYWIGRMRLLEEALNKKGYSYVLNIEKQFDKACGDIEKELAQWYLRLAKNNDISLAEAKKLLSAGELKEFHWSVEEYIEKGSGGNPEWAKQLENASAKFHITRLEAIQLQLQQKAEELYGNQLNLLDELLSRVYTEGYYHIAFELALGTGIGHNLMAIDERKIEKVLSTPWSADNRTFRDRCWTNKKALVQSVNTHLTQMIMRGEPPDRAIDAIAKDFNVSKKKSGRLVMTESAALSSVAQQDCFNELGVEKYRIIETLDSETCDLCGDVDNTIHEMAEFEVGVTAPPFHPWCRGCTAPYFEDMNGIGKRFARDSNGKSYMVPKDMSFKEWKEKFVE